MTIAKFLENLLLRDVFSYMIPGSLILLFSILFEFDRGQVTNLMIGINESFGPLYAAFAFGGISYVVGYLTSTAMFYFRGNVGVFRRPKITDIRPEILESITKVFGSWASQAEKRHLANICLHYVELNKPEYYYEKFERRVILRNFEVNISGVFVFLSIGLFYCLPGWWKLFGLFSLAGAYFLLLSSKYLDATIDRLSFTAFYVISSLENCNTDGVNKKAA